MPRTSSIAEAREALLSKSRRIYERMRQHPEQTNLDRRRLGRVADQLEDLFALEHLGIVPGAQITTPRSSQPFVQIVAVQPNSVSVRLPGGRERLMDATCLINLVMAEGAGVIPPPEA